MRQHLLRQGLLLTHLTAERVMISDEMREKQTPNSLCIQFTFKTRDAGVYLVKLPVHRLALGCWGARRAVRHSPCGAYCSSGDTALTFGGTRLAGLNGAAVKKPA